MKKFSYAITVEAESELFAEAKINYVELLTETITVKRDDHAVPIQVDPRELDAFILGRKLWKIMESLQSATTVKDRKQIMKELENILQKSKSLPR